VTDNIAIDLTLERSHYALNGRLPKFSNRATTRTDRVVVMFDSSDAVHRSTIENWQLAEGTGVYEVTNRSIHRRPADIRQLTAQLFCRKRIACSLDSTCHGRSRNSFAQASVL
jgi:hypothetical protein